MSLFLYSRFIPHLHDEANIKQTSSRYHANVFSIHVHDVCCNCFMFAWRLLHRLNGVLRLTNQRQGPQSHILETSKRLSRVLADLKSSRLSVNELRCIPVHIRFSTLQTVLTKDRRAVHYTPMTCGNLCGSWPPVTLILTLTFDVLS